MAAKIRVYKITQMNNLKFLISIDGWWGEWKLNLVKGTVVQKPEREEKLCTLLECSEEPTLKINQNNTLRGLT